MSGKSLGLVFFWWARSSCTPTRHCHSFGHSGNYGGGAEYARVPEAELMLTKAPNRNIQNLYEELVKAGKLKPVIDRCYPLGEVPEAFRYYAKGHAREGSSSLYRAINSE